ncbi:MAG: EamA family transporter [Thermoguttaceae bacterium]|nr:EamA family transporter [Thermoguttaceae bacterium]
MWKYYAVLSAVSAAATAILAKLGIQGMDSNLATAIRTLVVVVMTWGLVWCSGSWPQIYTLTRQNWLFLILSGLATGVSWLFYFAALRCGDASKVAPVDKLSVVLVIVFGILFLREPIDPKVVVGGLLIFAGTLVILW